MSNDSTILDFAYLCGQLARANADRRHPFTTLVLSSYDGESSQARWVVNRGWSMEHHRFMIYTDSRSPKVEALTAHPVAELTCYDPRKKLQVRAKCHCTITSSGPIYEAHRQRASNRASDYSTDLAPGTEAGEYTHTDDMHFAVIVAEIESYDVLQLGDPHQRVRYSRSDNWASRPLVP